MAPSDPKRREAGAAGPLLVTAPGAVLVATDALLAHLPELARLADEVQGDAHRTALLALAAPPGLLRDALERATRRGFDLAESVRRLRAGILAAEAGYTLAERTATRLQDAASDAAAGALGRMAVPFLAPAALAVLTGWHLAPGTPEQKKEAVQRFLLEHPELVTSPEFATLVRRIATGADDAVLGALGAPGLSLLLGEHGLGLLDTGTSARALILAGGLSGTRVLHETAVRVERVGEETGGTAAAGAEDRLSRVPAEQQVRIERYTAPGEEPRYVVYIAPTQTFSPVADSEPWDLTSNIAGVAGLDSGSIRATELAMADAGIAADSEVVLVGFSQGGLVADAIAGSGRWNAVGLETYGDPGGGIALPEGVRGLAVRHTDDLVVAIGGPQLPTDRTIVERQAYPEGVPLPTDRPVPAHQRDAYVETARMLDTARSPQLRAELDALDAFTRDYAAREGAEITTFRYQAERLPADSEVSASSS